MAERIVLLGITGVSKETAIANMRAYINSKYLGIDFEKIDLKKTL